MTNTMTTFTEQMQERARKFADNAVFPVPPILRKVLTDIEIERMDNEIFKVIDTITADTVTTTLKEVERVVEEVEKIVNGYLLAISTKEEYYTEEQLGEAIVNDLQSIKAEVSTLST